MDLLLATIDDLDAVLALHRRYHVDTISDKDRPDGFITTPFKQQQLQDLIDQEQGLFIAKETSGQVVAYLMAASWQYWSQWPIYQFMIEQLPKQRYQGIQLSVDNSFQYGPVCVDVDYRGSGLFAELFEFSLARMALRFSVLLTFVNKVNPRSYQAHTRKVGLDLIEEFSFNDQNYYELGCLTTR
ncbi:MAG: hypothetical protein V2I33_00515 [Kangiellaceae bacterium]|jgi:hypothetical protein|nr:hypothetical protein [Kangiellaceae bacterium]